MTCTSVPVNKIAPYYSLSRAPRNGKAHNVFDRVSNDETLGCGDYGVTAKIKGTESLVGVFLSVWPYWCFSAIRRYGSGWGRWTWL